MRDLGSEAATGLERIPQLLYARWAMPVDWYDWQKEYEKPGSIAQQRLLAVQRRVRGFLDSRPEEPMRIVSACAGQGRDVLGVLVDHPRRGDVRARLIEIDPRSIAAARSVIEAVGLGFVEAVEADAGSSDAYLGAVPADLVMMCGVFGNLSDGDIRATVMAIPELCAEGATVIWTRHRLAPDLTPTVRRWFEQAGFSEQAFDSPGPGADSYSVGVHRLTTTPRPLKPGQRLFTFIG